MKTVYRQLNILSDVDSMVYGDRSNGRVSAREMALSGRSTPSPWERSLANLKGYQKIKQVIWMSAIHRVTETGEPIPKAEQLVNVVDLMHKCREIMILLDLQKNGKIPTLGEKKILKRFEAI